VIAQLRREEWDRIKVRFLDGAAVGGYFMGHDFSKEV
jgi:hypothetical protein